MRSCWAPLTAFARRMMTVVAIMAGLVPILWSTGARSEVMQRIAVPMIGGMVGRAGSCLQPCRLGRTRSRSNRSRSRRLPSDRQEAVMMHDMMGGMGGMMWGMGLFGLVFLVLALLAIAALVKYVFFR